MAVVAEIMRETEGLQKSSNTTIRKFLNIEDMFLSDKAKEEMKIDRRYATSIMKNLIALLQSFTFSAFAADSLKIDQKEWVQISIFISDLFAFINEICIEQNAIISKSTDIFSFDVKDPSTESLNALMLENIHLIEVLHAYAYKEGFNELFSRASYENFIEAYLFVAAFNDSSDISKMIRMNGIAKKIENREAQLDFLTHQILQKQLIDIESKKIIFQDNPNLIFSQQDVMAVIDEYKTKLRKHYRSGNIDLELLLPPSSEKSIFDDINHTEQIIYIDYQPDKIHTILVNCIDCKRINEDQDIKYSYFSHYIDDDDDQQIRNYIDSIKTYPPTKDFYDLNVSVSKIFSNLVDICNIKNSNLTIITSNNLKEFPFHTIKDLATDKFIIENCSINYLPSIQSYGF